MSRQSSRCQSALRMARRWTSMASRATQSLPSPIVRSAATSVFQPTSMIGFTLERSSCVILTIRADLCSSRPSMLCLRARPADERRMVRTLEGNARAFLSDRYRPLDHDEILERVLPALGEFDLDWSQSSLEVTDQRLYMKLVNPHVEADVEVGDPVQAGVLVTNSEIGMGSFSVTPLVF